ncbi:MAG: hypothetical protein LBH28_01235, partial [Oscillospiraceae bacterium]|nr:hypothetical protein [Oscillospiraceae bacterium]
KACFPAAFRFSAYPALVVSFCDYTVSFFNAPIPCPLSQKRVAPQSRVFFFRWRHADNQKYLSRLSISSILESNSIFERVEYISANPLGMPLILSSVRK